MKRGKVTFRLLVKETPSIQGDAETVEVSTDSVNRAVARHAFLVACELLFDRTMDRVDRKSRGRTHLPFCELGNHAGDCMNFDPSSRVDEHAALWIEHEPKKDTGGDDDG